MDQLDQDDLVPKTPYDNDDVPNPYSEDDDWNDVEEDDVNDEPEPEPEEEEVAVVQTSEETQQTRNLCFSNANNWSQSVSLVTGVNDQGQPIVTSVPVPPKSTTGVITVLSGYPIDLPPRVKMMKVP